jgi:hypothetical protein
VRRIACLAVLACLLAVGLAACGSSGKKAAAPSPYTALRLCLRQRGYAITPESATVRATAPKRFEFETIWNLLNPDLNARRIALALAISRSEAGAQKAAVWTRDLNKKLGKGVVHAPVKRIGRVDVLWTAEPRSDEAKDVYRCVRSSAFA